MKEPANINTTTIPPAPTAIVYGMPAYVDLAAAVDEVHARPHLKCTRARICCFRPPGAYCSSLS